MPDTLRLAGALLAPHSHQEGDLLDGDVYARLAASETVAGVWGFPAAGITIGLEALSSPAAGLLAVGGDLAVGGSISLEGTVDGVDVSDHAALHERGGSQVVRAARLHSGADASKPTSGNTEGDVWWAADTDKLYVWDGATWKEIGAGGGGSLAIEEADVQVVAAASVLDFGAGFDVTESPSGEANIALDLTEAVWTFAQGGFRFRDGSGPLLFTGASGDDLFLTGDLDVSGVAAIGGLASIDAAGRMALRTKHYTGNITVPPTGWGAGGDFRVVCNTATSGFAFGVCGEIEFTGTANCYIAGLMFNAIQNGSATLSWLHGIIIGLLNYPGTGQVTDSKGLEVGPDYTGPRPTTFHGVHIKGHAGMNTVYGLRVEDFTGTTIRLLELGPSTPYLRLIGGGNPGANQTNLYLAEGVTPTLRRVRWKDYSDLAAGDKVLVLV
jgi:hypothetical protein